MRTVYNTYKMTWITLLGAKHHRYLLATSLDAAEAQGSDWMINTNKQTGVILNFTELNRIEV